MDAQQKDNLTDLASLLSDANVAQSEPPTPQQELSSSQMLGNEGEVITLCSDTAPKTK